jgi:cytochrome P450
MKTLEDAPFLDFLSAEFQTDPEPILAGLRQQSWVVRTAIGGLVISREHVQALLADRHLVSSLAALVRIQGVTDGPLYDAVSTSILAIDGDDHTRLRKLVSRAFTPRATDAHRPLMRTIMQSLVAPLSDRCDFMAAVAEHYPIKVMCHMLGVPDADHEEFAAWNRAITWALSLQLGAHQAEVEWGMVNMFEYVSALMAERRREPRDDMISALVQAHEADDRLSDDEVRSIIAALLFAGYDTTRNQLGLTMWLFATYPEQWKLLRQDPSLAARAIEESMRFRGAVAVAPRMVAEDFEFDGYRLTSGTMLTLSTAAANHDPAGFENPWEFDITVEREPHFTFGGGPHYCLGASLARAEMQEALPILAAAMPNLALDGEPTWRPPFGIFGPETLPIRYG